MSRRPSTSQSDVTMITRLAAFPVKRPSATLLFVQILSILVYPLMEDTPVERGLFRVIGLLVLGVALYVVKRGPWLTRFAVMLALPVVALSIWLAFDFDLRGQAIVAALSALFYFYATGSLIAYMSGVLCARPPAACGCARRVLWPVSPVARVRAASPLRRACRESA